ncbi:TIGR02594 family protein [Erythrobacter sp. NFXS35]|uniref:TIGR02594 family protein n=1 Tax=Erythrobacter sp. NFXS35 TaxID=2818436 RepID=UPI0032DFD12D
MTDPRKPIFDAVRAAAPGNPFNAPGMIDILHRALDVLNIPRTSAAAAHPSPHPTKEPRWLIEARARIGEKEIPGPRHNRWIAEGWKRLGAGWFVDDETPWCGLFVAHCIEHAGLPFPKMFPRAKAWADWGKPCPPAVGAVVVFGRQGGGHVGFLVGEDAGRYYVLGGNQSNAVNIMPIAKSRMVKNGIRWPSSLALPTPGLPKMTGGVVSTNEA